MRDFTKIIFNVKIQQFRTSKNFSIENTLKTDLNFALKTLNFCKYF